MNSLPSSLYTAALALCLFSAGLLRDRSNRHVRPFTYFTAFLAIESLCFVFELLMAHPATPLKALWLGLRMDTSLLIAPCLWLATREVTEGARPLWTSVSRRHLIPVFAGAICTLPLIGTAHFGTDYYNPSRVTTALHSRVIHGTMLLCMGVFAGQVPFYLWRCRRILMQGINLKNLRTQTENAPSLAWLHLPLLIVFTTWILGLLRTVQCASHAPQGFIALFALIEVSVTVGAIYSIFRRTSSLGIQPVNNASEHFVPLTNAGPSNAAVVPVVQIVPVTVSPSDGIPYTAVVEKCDTPAVASVPEQKPPAPPAVSPSKYVKSHLPPTVRRRIKRKLHVALATEEIYRNSLLNLHSLSATIKENAHYVSQVISQEIDSSFYQLVNQYRIQAAKKLLADSPGQTVLEIALAVGFNSKSTFNAAFRRNTGRTPREYRSAHRKN